LFRHGESEVYMDNTKRNTLIQRVYEGMKVVDADGKDIGKVEMVKMGDPEAMTTQGNEVGPAAGIVPLDNEYDEPEVPQPIRDDLLRVGFIKVDGANLFDSDRYFRADVIEAVEGDTVRIRLPESRLPVEGEEGTVHRVPEHDDRAGGGIVMPPAATGTLFPGGHPGTSR
jgi:hypothetical protein